MLSPVKMNIRQNTKHTVKNIIAIVDQFIKNDILKFISESANFKLNPNKFDLLAYQNKKNNFDKRINQLIELINQEINKIDNSILIPTIDRDSFLAKLNQVLTILSYHLNLLDTLITEMNLSVIIFNKFKDLLVQMNQLNEDITNCLAKFSYNTRHSFTLSKKTNELNSFHQRTKDKFNLLSVSINSLIDIILQQHHTLDTKSLLNLDEIIFNFIKQSYSEFINILKSNQIKLENNINSIDEKLKTIKHKTKLDTRTYPLKPSLFAKQIQEAKNLPFLLDIFQKSLANLIFDTITLQFYEDFFHKASLLYKKFVERDCRFENVIIYFITFLENFNPSHHFESSYTSILNILKSLNTLKINLPDELKQVIFNSFLTHRIDFSSRELLTLAQAGFNIQAFVELFTSNNFTVNKSEIAQLLYACYINDAYSIPEYRISPLIIHNLFNRMQEICLGELPLTNDINHIQKNMINLMFNASNQRSFSANISRLISDASKILHTSAYYQFQFDSKLQLFLEQLLIFNNKPIATDACADLFNILLKYIKNDQIELRFDKNKNHYLLGGFLAQILLHDKRTNSFINIELNNPNTYYMNDIKLSPTNIISRTHYIRDSILKYYGYEVVRFNTNDIQPTISSKIHQFIDRMNHTTSPKPFLFFNSFQQTKALQEDDNFCIQSHTLTM